MLQDICRNPLFLFFSNTISEPFQLFCFKNAWPQWTVVFTFNKCNFEGDLKLSAMKKIGQSSQLCKLKNSSLELNDWGSLGVTGICHLKMPSLEAYGCCGPSSLPGNWLHLPFPVLPFILDSELWSTPTLYRAALPHKFLMLKQHAWFRDQPPK